MTRAIGLVYGPGGARAFDQLWTQHIEFFLDYAEPRGGGRRRPPEAMTSSRTTARLLQLRHDGHRRQAAGLDAVLALLHEHVGQLLGQADQWAAGDWAAASPARARPMPMPP